MGFGGVRVRQSVCMVIVEKFSRSAKYKDGQTCSSPQFSLVLFVIFDGLGTSRERGEQAGLKLRISQSKIINVLGASPHHHLWWII